MQEEGGITATAYNAAMNPKDRMAAQNGWRTGSIQVCTSCCSGHMLLCMAGCHEVMPCCRTPLLLCPDSDACVQVCVATIAFGESLLWLAMTEAADCFSPEAVGLWQTNADRTCWHSACSVSAHGILILHGPCGLLHGLLGSQAWALTSQMCALSSTTT